jgi:hypothetical protein
LPRAHVRGSMPRPTNIWDMLHCHSRLPFRWAGQVSHRFQNDERFDPRYCRSPRANRLVLCSATLPHVQCHPPEWSPVKLQHHQRAGEPSRTCSVTLSSGLPCLVNVLLDPRDEVLSCKQYKKHMFYSKASPIGPSYASLLEASRCASMG